MNNKYPSGHKHKQQELIEAFNSAYAKGHGHVTKIIREQMHKHLIKVVNGCGGECVKMSYCKDCGEVILKYEEILGDIK